MPAVKSNKVYVFVAIIILTMIVFLIRIASLQLTDNEYKLSADNNFLKSKVVIPARGLIFDRNGKLLVDNKQIFELDVIPAYIEEFDTLELCSILGISKNELVKKLNSLEKNSFRLTQLISPVDEKTYLILSEKMYKFKGFYLERSFERVYPYANAAHVLGYIREVDKSIVDTSDYYQGRDKIGVTGIEAEYEVYLRGEKGISYYLVNSLGKNLGSYKNGKRDKKAKVGANITSTLDIDLQTYAEKLMQNKRGSIVAIEPSTGEILVMVSAPGFDPNLLTESKLRQNYGKLALDENRVLFNRAIGADNSPPGSTFKPVDAIIGLNEGVITTHTVINCYGGYNIGTHIVGCHHHSPIDFDYSIAGSCNTYYCEVFNRILRNPKYQSVEDAYRHWYAQMQKFGFGRKLGIDLPGERPGVLYSAEDYNRLYGKGRWSPFRIISLAIGQGEMGATTLQLANVAAIIANRGYYYVPHVVKKIDGETTINSKYLIRNYVDIDSSYFTPVVDAMENVFRHGTAAGVYLPDIQQCGKTGTAQNPHGENHSVFIEFAPKYNPKIAIAVYVENGGYGASTAAVIASLIVEKYLKKEVSRKDLETYIINKNLMSTDAKKKKIDG